MEYFSVTQFKEDLPFFFTLTYWSLMFQGQNKILIWMMKWLDAKECLMRSTLKQADWETKLWPKETRIKTKGVSYRTWKERSKVWRSRGLKCGERSHVLKKWTSQEVVRLENSKKNSKTLSLRSLALRLALKTLRNSSMQGVLTWEISSSLLKMLSAKTTEYVNKMPNLVPITLV